MFFLKVFFLFCNWNAFTSTLCIYLMFSSFSIIILKKLSHCYWVMLLFLFWVPFLVLGLVVCRFTSLFCTTLDVVFVGSNVSVLEIPFLNLDGSNVRPIEKHASSLSPPLFFWPYVSLLPASHFLPSIQNLSLFFKVNLHNIIINV